MDSRFLETFVLVAQLGSIAEASRRLGLTAAAVARRIDALESDIGSALILRSGRTMAPTEAGSAILEHAELIVRQCDDLRSIAAMDALRGGIRLGAIATAVTGLLADAVVRLNANYPEVELYMVPGTSKVLYEMLSRGELDAVVIVQPPFDLPKSLQWLPLRSEPLVVIAPYDMEPADADAILRREPLLRYDRSHWGGRLADLYLQSRSIKPRERFELDALDAIAVLVDRGLGVSILPDWSPPWPEGLKLRKIAVDAPDLERRLGLLWQRKTRRRRVIAALATCLQD